MRGFSRIFLGFFIYFANVEFILAIELDKGYELLKGVVGTCPDVINKTDARGFAACNCTSYVAYRLNLNRVNFSNWYGQVDKWSDAHFWDDTDRAGKAGIRVDLYPAVGSVAHWNAGSGASSSGHVAYVYKINVHGNGDLSSIEVAEYNYKTKGAYGIRTLTPSTSEYPHNFLHFEEKIDGEKPNATCVTNARNLPGGYGPFCWIHSQYSAACEHAVKWYYFDQQANNFYTLSSLSCPESGGKGSGYVTYIGDQPSQYTVGDNLEPSGQSPVSESSHSGKLPNLTMREVSLLDANKNPVSSLRVNKNGYCHMNIKNYGQKKAGGTFENRCWISKGKNFDGKDKAEDLGKEDMGDLDDGRSRSSDEDFNGVEWPGTYNLVGCTDASKKVTESNEKDNCNTGDSGVIKEYVFEVVSSPNLATTAIKLTKDTNTLQLNETFGIASTTTNLGENFGSEYVYIGYYVDDALIGKNQIRRENMKGGVSKIEEISLPGGISTTGNHEIKACADYDNTITEPNESDNCMTLSIVVEEKNVPPSVVDQFTLCPVITSNTWVSGGWIGLGNQPPFSEDGTLLINPSCKKSDPNSVEVSIGNKDNPTVVVYSTAYVKSKSTGALIPSPLTCSGVVNGGWCQGMATLSMRDEGINTASSTDPTFIFGFTCEAKSTGWVCPGWRIQGAGFPLQ